MVNNQLKQLRKLSLSVFVLFSIISNSALAQLPDFTELVKDNSSAVVNISTKQKVKAQSSPFNNKNMPRSPHGNDNQWGELFEKFFGGQGMDIPKRDTQSLGSGFIVDGDGFVLTNYHVVKNADEIIVRLSDRRELNAEIIGTDKRSDVALLKIDAKNLPVVKIGSSKPLKVGEWVMAIGSPFGFDHSVSVGVVSAMGRKLPNETYVPFIQTDVAINPGNSGGPLFNLKGEVVGVNSQIYSRTGGFMGLSFAIPIDIVMNVVQQLKENGEVSRGYLGILIQDVNRKLAESFNMDKPQGAIVLKVLPDSPAENAGFKIGDIVINFNDNEIIYSSDLPVVVGRTEIDKEVDVKIIREGKEKTIEVTIGVLPTEKKSTKKSVAHSSKKMNRLGVAVTSITNEQRKKLDLDKRGLLVKEIQKKGPAFLAGIRKGDVILMMNNQNVTSISQFNQLLKSLPVGKSLPVLIQRGTSPTFLAIKLPEND
ncbi:HtrA protease/chaperone protein [hydrothermal vent metagenome]|uniref:Probable periplasmic serine endoprotease DegP-like n=1 Tax=hydrothermal vent metagenome TaxID=652676 RepID=A0A3B1A096_9ZZZZ